VFSFFRDRQRHMTSSMLRDPSASINPHSITRAGTNAGKCPLGAESGYIIKTYLDFAPEFLGEIGTSGRRDMPDIGRNRDTNLKESPGYCPFGQNPDMSRECGQNPDKHNSIWVK